MATRVIFSVSSETRPAIRWPQLYLGLAFTTLATLMLELSLTRIFSVVFFYHFAFLAISVALFGLGAGGVFSYIVAGRPGNLFAKLGVLACVNAVAVPLALWYILTRPGSLSIGTLAGVYFASALPFFLAGSIVSLAISEGIERVDRTYFFDLAGAAAGCLVLIPFLSFLGGPNTVISAGVFYAVAGAIWFNLAGSAAGRVGAVILSLALAAMIVVNLKTRFLEVTHAKGNNLPQERFVAWNTSSRVGVHNYLGIWDIVIDADAATFVSSFDFDHLSDSDRAMLTHEGPGIPYLVRPGAKTLVIGAGGGYDIARSLASGSRDVTGVEINPIISGRIMRKEFVKENHGIYLRPEVRIVTEDGRSFVRRSDEKYQVIQATLVDTWAATAAGAFALTENNLYTTEAFRDYLGHLTDDGLLAFTRWGFDPPRESLRLISLAIDALHDLGEDQPANHVIVVRSDANQIDKFGAQDTVLISRKPFTAEDIARVREGTAGGKVQAIYLPGDGGSTPFHRLLLSPDRAAFFAQYPFNVAPVSDDQPFFFYTAQSGDLKKYLFEHNTAMDFKINRAVPLLFALIAISLAATAVILLLPRVLLGSHLPQQKGIFAFLWYFLCLGAGYILVQVALIQKFILLLGHPAYALIVVVFSMLVASGLGSYFSRRVVGSDDAGLIRILALVALLVAALGFLAPPLIATAAVWTMPAKVLATILCIAPAAFLMGMPFPSGLRRLEDRHPPSVRWAWSLNAAASVLGSAGAIIIAIYLGLRATLLIGGALYLCALAVILLTKQEATEA